MHREEEVVLIMGLALIVAGAAVIVMAMRNRRLYREMEHRERLAMIQHGVVPAPERDPAAFERAISPRLDVPMTNAASRARSAGVIMIALGIGFAFLMMFAAREPEVGIGIGGAFAILGGGFFVNAMLSSNRQGYVPPSFPPSRPPARSDQPPFPPQ